MGFLAKVLGIQVNYIEGQLNSEPNFIHDRYRLQKVALNGVEAVFVYPKFELDALSAVKKHMDRIKESEGVPAVLIPDQLTYRQREYLLREHIPFIVADKQIYLPFLAVYLQERCDAQRQTRDTLLPSAQMLLLYYIYQGCSELPESIASGKLNLTPTSISRASRQLEGIGLVHSKKCGVQKIICSERKPEELFAAASDYFRNPVKRKIYVHKTEIKEKLLKSGYSALSEYSTMNPPAVDCLAARSIASWESFSSGELLDSENQYVIEFWRYDPKILSEGDCVDRLSLAISLREDRDERVEEAVEEMLKKVWEEVNGKRNRKL